MEQGSKIVLTLFPEKGIHILFLQAISIMHFHLPSHIASLAPSTGSSEYGLLFFAKT
jgi:hypothetical protein